MLIGNTLVASRNGGTSENSVVSSPWFARSGDACTSSFEVIGMPGAATKVTVTLYHKDSETTGGGAANGSANLTSTDFSGGTKVKSFRSTGLKQLIRYEAKLEYTGSSDGSTVWSHFRILQPSFETTGAQDI